MSLKQRLRASWVGDLGRLAINGYWHLCAVPKHLRAWLRDRQNRQAYRPLSEQDLRAARRSDTVFICGTGPSLRDVTPEEWAQIGAHDVFSFRDFPRQRGVRADFHMTGEVDILEEYAAAINDNPLYANTLFLVQEGFTAWMGNRLIGERALRLGAPVFRYWRRDRGRMVMPSERFEDGVVHGIGSVVGAVNIALLLGWRRIVLVGVDLHNHRYFFVPEDQTRAVEKPGVTHFSPYTNGDLIVQQLGDWNDKLQPRSVQLYAYNPKSLLVRRLPVFDWGMMGAAIDRQQDGAA